VLPRAHGQSAFMRVDSIVQAHLGAASALEFQKCDEITVGSSRSVAHPQNEL
jgi:hypothetical protein